MPNEADAKFISSERMRRAKKERQGRAASPEPWARAITRYLYRFAVCRRLSQTSPSVRHLEKPHSLVRICRLLRNPQTLGGILLYRWAVCAAMQEPSPKKLILITRLAQDSSLDRKELCQRPARFVPPCRTRRHIGSTPRIAGGSRAQCPSTARNCLIWRRCGLILPQELKPPRETSRQRKARGDFNPTTEPNRSPIFKLSLS